MFRVKAVKTTNSYRVNKHIRIEERPVNILKYQCLEPENFNQLSDKHHFTYRHGYRDALFLSLYILPASLGELSLATLTFKLNLVRFHPLKCFEQSA
ncbi:hypothetical protein CWO06_21205 [Vibrio splendidus]|nr:hypothetical protein CWN83_25665 [Vibrio splendidus]PTP71424.1 hypothetical protein CWO06_21205 [Vibrio splendidus]